MPNMKGGKGFKKRKKQSSGYREKLLILRDKEEDQEYGQIKKVNGSGRYVVSCFDGTERLGISAGNIRKRYRIQVGDIVLLSLWTDIQDSKCSIIHKYDEDEARKLQSQGEFPATIQLDTDTDTALDNKSSYYEDDLFGYSEETPKDLPASEDDDDDDEDSDIDMDEI